MENKSENTPLPFQFTPIDKPRMELENAKSAFKQHLLSSTSHSNMKEFKNKLMALALDLQKTHEYFYSPSHIAYQIQAVYLNTLFTNYVATFAPEVIALLKKIKANANLKAAFLTDHPPTTAQSIFFYQQATRSCNKNETAYQVASEQLAKISNFK